MYLHELRLADAVKKLYMLGNRPYRGHGSGVADIGKGMVTAMSSVGQSVRNKDEMYRQAKLNLDKKKQVQTAAENHEQELDVASKYGQEGLEVRHGRAVPSVPMGDKWQALADEAAVHEQALEVPIAGIRSHTGLERADKHSDDIAHDMLLGRSLVGLGGSVPGQNLVNPPPYSQMKPGNF